MTVSTADCIGCSSEFRTMTLVRNAPPEGQSPRRSSAMDEEELDQMIDDELDKTDEWPT